MNCGTANCEWRLFCDSENKHFGDQFGGTLRHVVYNPIAAVGSVRVSSAVQYVNDFHGVNFRDDWDFDVRGIEVYVCGLLPIDETVLGCPLYLLG